MALLMIIHTFFSLCLADIPGHLGICTSVNIEDKLNLIILHACIKGLNL